MQKLIDEILSKQEIWFDEDGNILEEPIIQYVNSFKSSVDLSEYVNKALEKEKEQIKDAWDAGMSEGIGTMMADLDWDGEFVNYYKETYGE